MDKQGIAITKLEALILSDVFRKMRGDIPDNSSDGHLRAILELAERVEKMEASRNDGLATLNKGIDDLRQRIESRFAKMGEEHALDVTATDARMDRLSGILNEHEGRLREIENYTGLDVRSAPTATTRTTCGHPLCGQCYPEPPKPTIKGGWVNVYENGQMHHHRDKASADSAHGVTARIACIRIPDFTEGEGL